jgi:hypothetical protein
MAYIDFGAFRELTTERLVLRELLESDAEDVLVYRGDHVVQKRASCRLEIGQQGRNGASSEDPTDALQLGGDISFSQDQVVRSLQIHPKLRRLTEEQPP